jgi:hypothetical protein
MNRRTGVNLVTLFGLLSVGALPFATGCTTAYYGTMEKFGQHKRDILKSRIEAGRKDQEYAQDQFKTTYERFSEASGYDGGDFESVYNDLNREYERSEARAADVTNRIASIETVAADLFEEWQAELDLIQSAKLRGASAESLRITKGRYSELITAMKRAEAKMPPVLTAFRDQVLFLKHSLNARAIAALEGTLGEMESDVASLIRDIDVSIREAERFLQTLDSEA